MTTPDVQALIDRAGPLLQRGDLDGAYLSLREALAGDPNNIQALVGLGQIATGAEDWPLARQWLERLSALQPDDADTRLNLADVLLKSGDAAGAKVIADGLMAQMPHYPPVHFLMGHVQWALGDFEAAFSHFERARFDLVPVLFGQLQYHCHLRLADGDWRGYATQAEFLERNIMKGLPTWQPLLPMLTSDSNDYLARSAKSYAEAIHPPKPALWRGSRRAARGRTKVAFLTAELFAHPVAYLMAGPFEHFDHEAFEIVGISYGPASDEPIRQRIVSTFDEFHDVAHLDDKAIAELIYEKQIDIAVTLNGFANMSRPGILAHRPAAVQVSLLGYPGTMASPYIDYLIADRTVIPVDDVKYFAEKVVWLPDVYQPTDDKALIGAVPSRAEEGLPEDAFVFMAYNVPFKISPTIFDAWTRILQRVPGSVLWLASGSEQALANFRRAAQERGVDPARLVFAGRRPDRAEHVARHQLADLFLDTLPYNAHSTASDALWAGLPVISCQGATFPGRVCSSLLSGAGLPDMVTTSLPDYEDLAVALATDPARLAAVRQRVAAAKSSALFDTARYVRHLEDAFATMQAIRVAGQPPRAFAVDPRP